MKNLSLFVWIIQTAAAFFAPAALAAQDVPRETSLGVQEIPADTDFSVLFDWSLLWSGSWEEAIFSIDDDPSFAGTLQNRAEFKLQYLPLDLTLRAQALDRRKLDFELDFPWSGSGSAVTNFMGGLYHKGTGSRLLYGVIDEWGLPARLRNPWIRSPPFAENHKPIIADLKTSPNSTKNDELYLYLSTPFINLFSDAKLRGFVSFQNDIDTDKSLAFEPAISAGLDFSLPQKNNFLIEGFYFGKTLPPSKANTWFSDPPPMPEREFSIYAASALFSNPDFSVSADFAVSEAFAWGTDIYAGFGISYSPLIASAAKERPLLISLAFDGSGERFVSRDGSDLNEGFRSAAKVEWKSSYNSLLKIDTTLRSSGFGEDFYRSSTNFYYRFPSSARNSRIIKLNRISFSADRNADNILKAEDKYSTSVSINFNPRSLGINSVFGINFSGSFTGLSILDDNKIFYPIPNDSWNWKTASAAGEIVWTPYVKNKPGNFQLRAKAGCDFFPEKDDVWEVSLYSSIRFKNGRISFKITSPDFPEKWNWTVSWRLNIK